MAKDANGSVRKHVDVVYRFIMIYYGCCFCIVGRMFKSTPSRECGTRDCLIKRNT